MASITTRLSESEKQSLQKKASYRQMKPSVYVRYLIKQDSQADKKRPSVQKKRLVNYWRW